MPGLSGLRPSTGYGRERPRCEPSNLKAASRRLRTQRVPQPPPRNIGIRQILRLNLAGALLALLGLAFGLDRHFFLPHPVLAGPIYSLPLGLKATTIVQGIGVPTESCNIDATRALVLTKDGRIFLYANGVVNLHPLLSLDSVSFGFTVDGEAGLLSCLATTTNVWLYYSTTSDQVVSKFSFVSNRILMNSEQVLFRMPNGGSPFHTGSAMQWSADRKTIFLARGDSANCDPDDVAACAYVQDLTQFFGKILRVDQNEKGLPDNPFYNGNPNAATSKIWAYGFRNPWTFFVMPNNDLVVFDVGKNRREMVKYIKKGSQGNWPCREGSFDHTLPEDSWNYQPQPQKCMGLASPVDLSTLVYEYDHNGQGAAIVGGAIMSPALYRAPYAGKVLFGDFVQGWLRATTTAFKNFQPFGQASSVTRIKTGPSGRIWLISTDGDMIQEISDLAPPAPGPSPPPAPPPPAPLPPPANGCAATSRGIVPSIVNTVFQPIMFASQPELQWKCVANGGNLPCARDGRMFGNIVGGVRPIKLRGRRYSRGFGVRGESNIFIPVNGMCGSLTGVVGLDDTSAPGTAVLFKIFINGKLIWQNRRKAADFPMPFGVSLVGAKNLTLVTSQKAGGLHNAVWGNPLLACGPNSPYLPIVRAFATATNMAMEPGNTLQVAATGFDYLGKAFATPSFNWQLNIRHCQGNLCHSHPAQLLVKNASRANFKLPWHEDCIWYEAQVVGTDRCGRQNWAFATISVPSKESVCAGSGVGSKRQMAASDPWHALESDDYDI